MGGKLREDKAGGRVKSEWEDHSWAEDRAQLLNIRRQRSVNKKLFVDRQSDLVDYPPTKVSAGLELQQPQQNTTVWKQAVSDK